VAQTTLPSVARCSLCWIPVAFTAGPGNNGCRFTGCSRERLRSARREERPSHLPAGE
jgi:hypothetical protein